MFGLNANQTWFFSSIASILYDKKRWKSSLKQKQKAWVVRLSIVFNKAFANVTRVTLTLLETTRPPL